MVLPITWSGLCREFNKLQQEINNGDKVGRAAGSATSDLATKVARAYGLRSAATLRTMDSIKDFLRANRPSTAAPIALIRSTVPPLVVPARRIHGPRAAAIAAAGLMPAPPPRRPVAGPGGAGGALGGPVRVARGRVVRPVPAAIPPPPPPPPPRPLRPPPPPFPPPVPPVPIIPGGGGGGGGAVIPPVAPVIPPPLPMAPPPMVPGPAPGGGGPGLPGPRTSTVLKSGRIFFPPDHDPMSGAALASHLHGAPYRSIVLNSDDGSEPYHARLMMSQLIEEGYNFPEHSRDLSPEARNILFNNTQEYIMDNMEVLKSRLRNILSQNTIVEDNYTGTNLHDLIRKYKQTNPIISQEKLRKLLGNTLSAAMEAKLFNQGLYRPKINSGKSMQATRIGGRYPSFPYSFGRSSYTKKNLFRLFTHFSAIQKLKKKYPSLQDNHRFIEWSTKYIKARTKHQKESAANRARAYRERKKAALLVIPEPPRRKKSHRIRGKKRRKASLGK